ncbi:hypothetical protein JHK82_029651 [Glycine max]|nr:hypothetical protein JHK86_057248 [Glycine max]KAG4914295.1 hypothetical protein JHK87_051852 [Glycine soja]KAG4906051.1 hypothetical protein JHK86_057298 [Glycine max]KAG4906067.1 hypothetical protein JHK86_057314 [Glycine max]KAG4906120.1 hypothetical protein JHK86_057342 [Glycine max]
MLLYIVATEKVQVEFNYIEPYVTYFYSYISLVYLNTRQAQERIFNQNRAIALFSLNCLSFIDEGFAISKIGLDITSQGSVDLTVLSPARKPLVSMDMDVI